jgi:hypothetical protein
MKVRKGKSCHASGKGERKSDLHYYLHVSTVDIERGRTCCTLYSQWFPPSSPSSSLFPTLCTSSNSKGQRRAISQCKSHSQGQKETRNHGNPGDGRSTSAERPRRTVWDHPSTTKWPTEISLSLRLPFLFFYFLFEADWIVVSVAHWMGMERRASKWQPNPETTALAVQIMLDP